MTARNMNHLSYRLAMKVANLQTQVEELEAERSKNIVEVFFMKGETPFMTAVYGEFDFEAIEAIEKDFLENADVIFVQGDGDYRLIAHHEPHQIGEFGRIEVCGGWHLDVESFKKTLPEPPE